MKTMTQTCNDFFNSTSNIVTLMVKGYMVCAKTINGGRFFSELLDNDEADIRVKEYGSMVSYFGGGIVQKFIITDDDAILDYDKVYW